MDVFQQEDLYIATDAFVVKTNHSKCAIVGLIFVMSYSKFQLLILITMV